MKNTWITVGAAAGFLGVAIGAFGAHSLKPLITPELLESYKTGVLYHLLHSVVIVSIGLTEKSEYKIPAILFSAGIVLFSFSLYVYSLTEIRAFAFITPFGGLSLLAGWLILLIVSFKKHK